MEKVVIVTGASGGLGSEIALKFGAAGAKVVVNFARARDAAGEVAQRINKGMGQAFIYQADVRNFEELKGLVEEVVRKWDRIDVVVNAAGGALAMLTKKENKSLLDHTEDDWDLVIDVNLKGSFNVLRAAAPQMIKQKDGHIILVSSGTGLRPGKIMSSYAAAKAGVNGLMKAAAVELGQYNIKVNAINPGLITHEKLCLGGVAPDGYIGETMLGRLSTAEDLADFVLFISQKDNLSGQIFNNDSRMLF